MQVALYGGRLPLGYEFLLGGAGHVLSRKALVNMRNGEQQLLRPPDSIAHQRNNFCCCSDRHCFLDLRNHVHTFKCHSIVRVANWALISYN
jgi:hypothetical protein